MNFLADTHVFLWWLSDNPTLDPQARKVLSNPTCRIYVSAASVWELSIKIKLGRLEFEGDPVEEITANGFLELPISAKHALMAGALPRHHDDPFDRMLIAQAQLENLILLTRDSAFPAYGIPLLPA